MLGCVWAPWGPYLGLRSQALTVCVGMGRKWAPQLVESNSETLCWDGDWLNGHFIYKLRSQASLFRVGVESKTGP